MRIGLLSDTHSLLDPAIRAIEEMGSIDLLIHAGDHYRDASVLASVIDVPVHAVVGNCDSRTEGPDEKLLVVEGVTIFVTHGHRYDVYTGIYKLYNRAVESGANVVVYGHTHISGYAYTPLPGSSSRGGLLIINPGSVSKPREGDRCSYGILEVQNGEVKPEIRFL